MICLKKPDIIGGILGILISIYVLYESAKFPKDIVMKVGPGYFPRLLAVALFAASVLLIINALRGKSRKKYEKFNIKDPGIHRAGIALLATISYCLVLKYLGFIISSVLYLMFLMYLLKKRNYVSMIVISACISIGIYSIFQSILNITLPMGVLSELF